MMHFRIFPSAYQVHNSSIILYNRRFNMIKNIIFDLGGVIIAIDYKKTSAAFKQLGANDFDKVYAQAKQTPLFDEFETGKITAGKFRHELQQQLNINVTDQEFDEAWNAMLLHIPKAVIDYLGNKGKNYRLFAYSNTNEIHLKRFFEIVERDTGLNRNGFHSLFQKVYYSHVFTHRKPDVESFQLLLTDSKLQANKTIFIDDGLEHVVGAQDAGIYSVHLEKQSDLITLLNAKIEEFDALSLVFLAHDSPLNTGTAISTQRGDSISEQTDKEKGDHKNPGSHLALDRF